MSFKAEARVIDGESELARARKSEASRHPSAFARQECSRFPSQIFFRSTGSSLTTYKFAPHVRKLFTELATPGGGWEKAPWLSGRERE